MHNNLPFFASNLLQLDAPDSINSLLLDYLG